MDDLSKIGMKTVISVASVLACAFALDAKIAVTLNRLPEGMDEVRIRNNSATSLVAFVVTARYAATDGPFVVYSDPLIDSAARPLLASEERVIMKRGTGKGRRLLEAPIVTAGIFADGATTGDANLIVRGRSNMLLAVETALEMLLDAGRSNVPRHQLIKQFTKMADLLNRWYLSPEQQVGRGLYQSIVGKLMSLPEEQVGSPFPPSAFVAQETAALNRQRVTLLESQPSLADAALIGR